jgi:hypothetical protein
MPAVNIMTTPTRENSTEKNLKDLVRSELFLRLGREIETEVYVAESCNPHEPENNAYYIQIRAGSLMGFGIDLTQPGMHDALEILHRDISRQSKFLNAEGNSPEARYRIVILHYDR